MTDGAEKEYVTFRELVAREEKMLEKFEVILNKHFGLFEKDINNRFVSYGHDIAEELKEMRKSIISELREDAPAKNQEEPESIRQSVQSALSGRSGFGPWLLALAIIFLIVGLKMNPVTRPFVAFVPF